MPPKKFRTPVLPAGTPPKHKSKSLSTSHDELFNAVISKQSRHIHDFKSPIVGKSPDVNAFSPKECASLENSQNTSSQKQRDEESRKQEKIKRTPITSTSTELIVSLNKPKQVHSESSNNQSESVSTVYSEEFRKNAVFSTPVIRETTKKKQKSFREAVQTLKESESQLTETLVGNLSQAQQTSLNNSLLVDVPLSQPPEHLNHRERLLWLQARRGEKVFVQCDDCDKWRLSDVQDPVDLPDKWYCRLNKDRNFNNCSIPEQKLSIYVEADLIINQYTAGSLVWAKIFSYPWWPAMVDDDPDTEQFYWIEDYDLNIPKFYNVTFFDRQNEPVTRAWITSSNLKSFKHNLDLDMKNVPNPKYRARVRYAKEIALDAMELPIKERLIQYSFISKTKKRINTPVGTPVDADSDDEINISRDIKTIKKRRRTVDDSAAQLKKRLVKESKKEAQTSESADKKAMKPPKTAKKITNRRKTIAVVNELQSVKDSKQNDIIKNKTDSKVTKKEKANLQNLAENEQNALNEKKEKKYQKSRISVLERDSSQESNVSTRRRSARLDTSIESDRSLSKETAKATKITKRRSTISVQDSKVSQKPVAEKEKKIPNLEKPKQITNRRNTRLNTSNEQDGKEKQKNITKRRNTIAVETQKPVKEVSTKKQKDEKVNTSKQGNSVEINSSQDSNVSTRRRSARLDTSIESLNRSVSKDLTDGKKITQRRSTISVQGSKVSLTPVLQQEKEKKLPNCEEPKTIDRRRNTRANLSIDRESSFSERETQKIVQSSAKVEVEQKGKRTSRRNTILESSERDSSQDLAEPNKISRRVTRADTSFERDSNISQDSNKEKRITKRRSTISVHEVQESPKTVSGRDKLEKEEKEKKASSRSLNSSQISNEPKKTSRNKNSRGDTSIGHDSSFSRDSSIENKITKLRATIADTLKETPKSDLRGRDSSQNSNKDTSIERCSRVTRRRMTIGKLDSQNSDYSQNAIKEEFPSHTPILERESSVNLNASVKIIKRKNTPDNSQELAQKVQKYEPNNENENKENTIKRRRNTSRESSSQKTSSTENITKRRSTVADTSLEGDSDNKAIKERNMQQIVSNSQNENKRRRNSIREKDPQRDSSQNSDDSRKYTKRKATLLEANTEKEKTSSQSSQKEKKVSKRRTTIAEFNHQSSNAEESQNTEGKVNQRRNTTKKDTSLINLSTTSLNSSKLSKRRNTFICPTVSNLLEETPRLDEPKKPRRTLGARKIVSIGKAKTSAKGSESGYESAISTKRDETNKKNLSMILEESYKSPSRENIDKYHIPKKRRQTTDCQFDDSITSLSHSLEKLDKEKRKKKFMAICKEIVNIDKDPADPTISAEEKLFYQKLNTSLEQVKEKRGITSDEKLKKKVKDFEYKLDKALSENSSSKPASSITSANTSMHSDFSDIDIKRDRMLSKKKSSSHDRLLKKKPHNSSMDSEEIEM